MSDTTKALGPSNDHIPAEEIERAVELARIGARNQRFARKAPAEQRVAIAKDVLRWLAMGKVVATPNIYLNKIEGSDNDYTVDGGTCTACALGALLACAVERGTQTPARRVNWMNRTDMHNVLSPYFSLEQLKEIETAFEISTSTGGGSLAASAFGRAVDADYVAGGEARMKAIMKNIIRNHGTFVPLDAP